MHWRRAGAIYENTYERKGRRDQIADEPSDCQPYEPFIDPLRREHIYSDGINEIDQNEGIYLVPDAQQHAPDIVGGHCRSGECEGSDNARAAFAVCLPEDLEYVWTDEGEDYGRGDHKHQKENARPLDKRD